MDFVGHYFIQRLHIERRNPVVFLENKRFYLQEECPSNRLFDFVGVVVGVLPILGNSIGNNHVRFVVGHQQQVPEKVVF